MARSTTVSVWRSNGGDQTRTTTAGSMGMYATFYIANIAASGNVTANSSLSNSKVILPAGAVVTSVAITSTGTGRIDLGFSPLSGIGPGQTTTVGTNVPQGFIANTTTATRAAFGVGASGAGASIGNVANATNVVVVTSVANGTASGSVSGYIHYFVSDDGSQEV